MQGRTCAIGVDDEHRASVRTAAKITRPIQGSLSGRPCRTVFQSTNARRRERRTARLRCNGKPSKITQHLQDVPGQMLLDLPMTRNRLGNLAAGVPSSRFQARRVKCAGERSGCTQTDERRLITAALELEIWSFPGPWGLELGASALSVELAFHCTLQLRHRQPEVLLGAGHGIGVRTRCSGNVGEGAGNGRRGLQADAGICPG